MLIKKTIIFLSIFLVSNTIKAMVTPGTSLKDYPYTEASILPLTSWNQGQLWALLGQDASTGYWSDFGGAKISGEAHPSVTAARTANAQTRELLEQGIKNINPGYSLRSYIDLNEGNTLDIAVSLDAATVIYTTKFPPQVLEYVTKRFFSQPQSGKIGLCWVEFQKLQSAVAHAERDDKTNKVKGSVTLQANKVNPANSSLSGQIKNQTITLSPTFVNKLQSHYRYDPHIQGKSNKIYFYPPTNTGTPQPIKATHPRSGNQASFDLATYDYKQASLLPYAQFRNGIYYLLSQDNSGQYQGTWSDFNTTKRNDPDSLVAAARAGWTQSGGLLTQSMDKLIDLMNTNIEKGMLIVTLNQQATTYIMPFLPSILMQVTENFYETLKKHGNPTFNQKKAIAWVKKEDLATAINQAQIVEGKLISSINAQGLVIQSYSPSRQPTFTQTQIVLNPLFVARLTQYLNNEKDEFQNSLPNARVYKGIEIQNSQVLTTSSLHYLNELASSLNSLSANVK